MAGALPDRADFSTFTFVNSTNAPSSADAEIAAEVSRILGLDHRIQVVPENLVSQVAVDVIALTGGLRPVHHPAKAMLFVNEVVQSPGIMMGGASTILEGYYIDGVEFCDPGKTSAVVHDFCVGRKQHTEPALALIFRKDLLAELFPQIDNSMFASFENIRGPTAAHRVTAWSMSQYLPAFTFTSPIHNHPTAAEAFPHLGYRYCNLMRMLPADWVYDKGFYKFMTYHCLPELRHVVYAKTGLPLSGKPPGIPTQTRFEARRPVSRRIMRIGKGLVPAGLRGQLRHRKRRRSYPFEHSLMREDQNLISEVIEILQSYPTLGELFDVPRSIKFVRDFVAGQISSRRDAELFGGLVTACYRWKSLN